MTKKLTRAAAALLAVCLFLPVGFIPVHAAREAFRDVPESHWANFYVEKAYSLGLIAGVGEGNYAPDAMMSYAEWAAMITALFYKNQVTQLDKKQGGGKYWWTNCMTASSAAFTGTAAHASYLKHNETWQQAAVTANMTRYDMAMVVANIAYAQNWQSGNTAAVADKMPDWLHIPFNYREAVKYCYASGLISGIDGEGTFGGNFLTTRGTAAVILCALSDAKNGTHDFGDRDADARLQDGAHSAGAGVKNRLVIQTIRENVETVTGLQSEYEVFVIGDAIPNRLANGKVMNEENIKAILAELEEIFPHGTSWGTGVLLSDVSGTSSGGDLYYYEHKTWGIGAACNSWAYMTADLLWGTGAQPFIVTNPYDIKVGDVIHQENKATGFDHWAVVIDRKESVTGAQYAVICDGNRSGKVSWDTNNYLNEYGISEETLFPDSTIYTFYE